jgi:thiamine biosynthesis lipoprotein
MDPRTGEPMQDMLQATVITPKATDSDAISTAMFVMGSAKGVKLLEELPETIGIWVTGEARSPKIASWHWPEKIAGAEVTRRN